MSKGKVVVRPAVPEDRDAIAALVRGLNEIQNDPVENFTAESVDRDIFGADPSIEALIGELDGRSVAYAFFHGAYESGWAARGLYVSDLFVAPEGRRHGVARALMAAIAREAKARKKSYLWWTSSAWNAEAHEFYAALGANAEDVKAHALTFEAFEALAQEGADADGDNPKE